METERRKRATCAQLEASQFFVPVAVEPLGVFGPEACSFIILILDTASQMSPHWSPFLTTTSSKGNGGAQLQFWISQVPD